MFYFTLGLLYRPDIKINTHSINTAYTLVLKMMPSCLLARIVPS